MEFIYAAAFDRAAAEVFRSDHERDHTMSLVEAALIMQPDRGDLMPRPGGARKLRAAIPGKGKRGGARVVYVYFEHRGRIFGRGEHGRARVVRRSAEPEHAASPAAFDGGRTVAMRQRLGISRARFAAALNVSESTLQIWERGTRHPSGSAVRLLEFAESHPGRFSEYLLGASPADGAASAPMR